MSQSPYDRTAAFIRSQYPRSSIAFCALVLVAAWTLRTLYEVLSGPSVGVGWYFEVRTVISEAGSGLILAAGVVWLVDRARGD